MIHIGKNTRSNIVSKGISAGQGHNTYRGLVKIEKNAEKARNYTQCDSMLIGDNCGAHTFPYIEVKNSTAHMEDFLLPAKGPFCRRCSFADCKRFLQGRF